MIWKILTGAVLSICIIGTCFLVIEAGYFYWIINKKDTLKSADAIVIFAGSYDRIKVGYDLFGAGIAEFLVISPASEKQLKNYEDRKGYCSKPKYIIENKARTTFENAVYTREIVLKYNLKSLILLTSSYHLPRSYLLLKTALIGTNTKIQLHGIGNPSFKEIYPEMIKLWASLGEFAWYGVYGRLPERHPKSLRAVQFLQGILL